MKDRHSEHITVSRSYYCLYKFIEKVKHEYFMSTVDGNYAALLNILINTFFFRLALFHLPIDTIKYFYAFFLKQMYIFLLLKYDGIRKMYTRK